MRISLLLIDKITYKNSINTSTSMCSFITFEFKVLQPIDLTFLFTFI